MLKNVSVLFVLILTMTSVVALASDSSMTEEIFGGTIQSNTADDGAIADNSTDLDQQAQSHEHWEFLGCVSSHEQCHHTAEHRGYHHYRASRDHHTCHDHHHPYACYGAH